jgi:septal ring factor EnvC (AmiA/AmiB activator)
MTLDNTRPAALAVLILLTASCANKERELRDELAAAQVTIASQQKQLQDRDARIQDLSQSKTVFAETVLEIERSLERLGARVPEATILKEQIEGGLAIGSQRERLQDMVAQLERIHDDLNRQAHNAHDKLAAAEKKLAAADSVTKALYEQRLRWLGQSLRLLADENRDLREDIVKYQNQLLDAQHTIDTLSGERDAQTKARVDAEAQLERERQARTAESRERYLGRGKIAPKRTLRELRLIVRPSGISRDYKPACSRCSACEEMDLSTAPAFRVEVPAPYDAVKVYTEHPTGSWHQERDGRDKTAIVITNPEIFWKYGKCFIVGY